MTNTVKETMAISGMTQRELSVAVGIGESHLNRIINGKLAPGVDLASRIAAALDKTVDELWLKPERA